METMEIVAELSLQKHSPMNKKHVVTQGNDINHRTNDCQPGSANFRRNTQLSHVFLSTGCCLLVKDFSFFLGSILPNHNLEQEATHSMSELGLVVQADAHKKKAVLQTGSIF